MSDRFIISIVVRNTRPIPLLEKEGVFSKPLPSPPPPCKGAEWHVGLSTHQRLFYHHTLSSVRASRRFRATPEIPRDSLDFALQSRYNQSSETFAPKVDSVMQRETCARTDNETFRRLRNTRVLHILAKDQSAHPLRFGGCKEKVSPHSVKLIHSGPHTQFVNNGFSRQSSDGNCFRY